MLDFTFSFRNLERNFHFILCKTEDGKWKTEDGKWLKMVVSWPITLHSSSTQSKTPIRMISTRYYMWKVE